MEKEYGPIASFIGVWQGTTGHDVSPSDDRGTEINKFREVIEFAPSSPAQNHEQTIWPLNYKLHAFRIGEDKAFHEEFGYLTWDPNDALISRILVIPRGLAILAHGKYDGKSKKVTLTSQYGTDCNGLLSNPFLNKEFRMLEFTCHYEWSDTEIKYEQKTLLQIKGMKEPFAHTDTNTLKRQK